MVVNLQLEIGHSALHVDLTLPIDVLGLFELFAQLADGLFEIEVVHLDVSSVYAPHRADYIQT